MDFDLYLTFLPWICTDFTSHGIAYIKQINSSISLHSILRVYHTCDSDLLGNHGGNNGGEADPRSQFENMRVGNDVWIIEQEVSQEYCSPPHLLSHKVQRCSMLVFCQYGWKHPNKRSLMFIDTGWSKLYKHLQNLCTFVNKNSSSKVFSLTPYQTVSF